MQCPRVWGGHHPCCNSSASRATESTRCGRECGPGFRSRVRGREDRPASVSSLFEDTREGCSTGNVLSPITKDRDRGFGDQPWMASYHWNRSGTYPLFHWRHNAPPSTFSRAASTVFILRVF